MVARGAEVAMAVMVVVVVGGGQTRFRLGSRGGSMMARERG